MDCAVASAFGLSAGDCCFVFRAAELEKHTWRNCHWNCRPLVAGMRGWVFEKTGSADDDRPVCFHAESAVSWQRSACGWSGVGNAFMDYEKDDLLTDLYTHLRAGLANAKADSYIGQHAF